MLFGARLLLLSAHGTAGGDVLRLHHRRMALLGGIGLVHACVFWYGDMLVSFALCGVLVFGLRGLPARRLLAGGALVLGLASVIALGVGASMGWWPEDVRAGFRQVWAPSPEMVAAVSKLMRLQDLVAVNMLVRTAHAQLVAEGASLPMLDLAAATLDRDLEHMREAIREIEAVAGVAA